MKTVLRKPSGDDVARHYDAAHRSIEGLEADVEAARSEVFSALNSATALRHALEHAGAAGDRVAETLAKLDVEFNDVRIESERVEADRAGALESLRRRGHLVGQLLRYKPIFNNPGLTRCTLINSY